MYMIFSADLDTTDRLANDGRFNSLLCDLAADSWEYQEVAGYYEGTKERSFLVYYADAGQQFKVLTRLARKYGQKSVCIIERGALARILNLKTNRNDLEGKWTLKGSLDTVDTSNLIGYTVINNNVYTIE